MKLISKPGFKLDRSLIEIIHEKILIGNIIWNRSKLCCRRPNTYRILKRVPNQWTDSYKLSFTTKTQMRNIYIFERCTKVLIDYWDI